jgi:hypothetical protein
MAGDDAVLESGASAPRGGAGRSATARPIEARLISGAWAFLKDVPAGILTLLTLWVFTFVPQLRPWEPPQEKSATISNVTVAERRFVNPDEDVMTVVLFTADTVGFDRRRIRIATLYLDAVTNQRVGLGFQQHGELSELTRTQKSVIWIEVPYPEFDFDDSGCVVIRVFAYEPLEATPIVPEGTMERFTREDILAYADSQPFDPFAGQGAGSCPAPNVPATPLGG